jgi:serine/threonine protein kinase
MGTTRTCSSCGDRLAGTLDRCPKDGTALFSEEIMSRVGMLLKDHEILGVIGEGGMGVVYRAQHVVIEKPVAIKVLYDRFARQKEMVEQFIVEAKAASRIRHPNIIDVTDFGTTPEGMVFLVMEYLDGESLEERLHRVHRLPLFEAINIVRQVAHGLGAAHELGIIHRDLKPANIFLCVREGRRRIVRRSVDAAGAQFTVEPEESFDFVKLLDFGVAKFMDLGPSVATRAGVFCGTPHYLSPEQAQERPATERSDLYALGAVFYEMVTGTVPFGGSSMLEILTGHVAGELIAPSRRAPDAGLGADVDAVIGKCLEKDPERRFASADEFVEALRECVTDRAFLRDAHRLPGIQESGIDLREASPRARRARSVSGEGARSSEDGFSMVESERPRDDLADLEDGPAVDAEFPRETMRLPRHPKSRASLITFLALLLVGGAVTVIWFPRGGPPDRGLNRGAIPTTGKAAGSVTAAPVPPPAVPAKPQAQPASPSPAPVGPHSPPGVPTASVAAAPPAVPAVGPVKTAERAPGRPVGTRPGAGSGAGAWKPPPVPVPPVPVPAETAVPAPEPIVAKPAPAPAPSVDVDAFLREAQQAYMRRYYALAIEKAREVLRANAGQQTAHQIIAASSCALGAAADAREAMTHLDEHKRKLVQSLCERNGVSLE